MQVMTMTMMQGIFKAKQTTLSKARMQKVFKVNSSIKKSPTELKTVFLRVRLAWIRNFKKYRF